MDLIGFWLDLKMYTLIFIIRCHKKDQTLANKLRYAVKCYTAGTRIFKLSVPHKCCITWCAQPEWIIKSLFNRAAVKDKLTFCFVFQEELWRRMITFYRTYIFNGSCSSFVYVGWYICGPTVRTPRKINVCEVFKWNFKE